MTLSSLLDAIYEPARSVYVRDDGERAILVSLSEKHVYFRRHEDGELLRTTREAFARRYRRTPCNPS